MREKGFEARALRGGFDEWIAKGFAVEQK